MEAFLSSCLLSISSQKKHTGVATGLYKDVEDSPLKRRVFTGLITTSCPLLFLALCTFWESIEFLQVLCHTTWLDTIFWIMFGETLSAPKVVSMIRKNHNHKLQTKGWHCEEEPHNNHETPGRQSKQSNQLSQFTAQYISQLINNWPENTHQVNSYLNLCN